MRKYLLAFVGVVALTIFGMSIQEAQAQGIHFQTRRAHLDIGQPHGYYGSGGNYWGSGYPSSYSRGYHSNGHSDWHNTTHLDYQPGGYQRHYNHYEYVPHHYDVHSSGHWDSHF